MPFQEFEEVVGIRRLPLSSSVLDQRVYKTKRRLEAEEQGFYEAHSVQYVTYSKIIKNNTLFNSFKTPGLL